MAHDCHRSNWLCRSIIVRTKSSTADLATNNEWADNTPLIHPYANPLRSRIRGLAEILGTLPRNHARTTIPATNKACIIIQITNVRRPRSNSSWSSVWAGSGIAPNIAISIAPVETNNVPPKDHLVNGSPNIKVAQMELKTRPEACSVDNTGSGKVVIWIVLPTRFDIINMPIPNCHLLLLYGGLRTWCAPFSSSRICDLRWRVKPILWTLVDISPTNIPICQYPKMVVRYLCDES